MENVDTWDQCPGATTRKTRTMAKHRRARNTGDGGKKAKGTKGIKITETCLVTKIYHLISDIPLLNSACPR